jgi:hypothetical protein
VVVCTVLGDITYQHAIYVGKGDKERFTKVKSIFMGKPLIMRDQSGLLTVIIVVIRDELRDGSM